MKTYFRILKSDNIKKGISIFFSIPTLLLTLLLTIFLIWTTTLFYSDRVGDGWHTYEESLEMGLPTGVLKGWPEPMIPIYIIETLYVDTSVNQKLVSLVTNMVISLLTSLPNFYFWTPIAYSMIVPLRLTYALTSRAR